MPCERCNGTGRQTYRRIGDAMATDIGGGVSVQSLGGHGTRACQCVRDLPAIHGEATWWETESIYSEIVDVPIGCECIEVAADCEVPRRDDGRRLHRAPHNAWYPPLVTVESPASVTLHAQDARKLADALTAAADACEARDRQTFTRGFRLR